jgi:hypothetical protein
MITLGFLFIIILVITSYRIDKACKKQGITFNPLATTLVDWIGFLFGVVYTFVFIIVFCIKYLP